MLKTRLRLELSSVDKLLFYLSALSHSVSKKLHCAIEWISLFHSLAFKRGCMPKKILYGVQATGNGHISRCREIIRSLKALNNSVDVLFSGREESKLWDVDDFTPYEVRRGITYVTRNGSIQPLQTALNVRPLRICKDISSLDLSGYDLVISDFEPITAWAAYKQKKNMLGMGHQYAFVHPSPIYKGSIVDKAIMKYFAPATRSVGFHWYHFDQPILPPVMPPQGALTHDAEDTKILVYLLWENKDKIISILSKYRDFSFYVYMGASEAADLDNIHIRPFSRSQFLIDMATSAGVISNAGFQMGSECLHFGKKMLIKPLMGQFEQVSNARLLDSFQRATVVSDFNHGVIANWLLAPQQKPLNYPDVATAVAEWITHEDMEDVHGFCKNVWSKIDFSPPQP